MRRTKRAKGAIAIAIAMAIVGLGQDGSLGLQSCGHDGWQRRGEATEAASRREMIPDFLSSIFLFGSLFSFFFLFSLFLLLLPFLSFFSLSIYYQTPRDRFPSPQMNQAAGQPTTLPSRVDLTRLQRGWEGARTLWHTAHIRTEFWSICTPGAKKLRRT